MSADRDARNLVDSFTQAARPAAKRAALAQWALTTDATPRTEDEAAAAQVALARLYADDATYREASRLASATIGDPELRREVELLHLATLAYRREPEVLERIVALETELESAYSTYRGTVDGVRVSENDVRTILQSETDVARRRQAWEAAKGIGPAVAPRILELARLRNGVARALGHRDWFALALYTDELDETWLLSILDEVDRRTDEPFAAEKRVIDAEASAWLGVGVDELRPWHYQDVFFQEAPTTRLSSLDPLLASRDVVDVALRFYDDLGFGDDVRAILARSDLYPRDGKTQHAFCSHIDREGDVRVVCNVAPTERWLETTLHELGHGIYDHSIATTLPWGLRAPSHTFTTEAIAMLMGRRTRDRAFLERYVGPRSDAQAAADRALLRRRMLLLARWVSVMTRFERELYAEPARDPAALGRIWWDLVERHQRVRRPDEPRPTDWATKIHVALAPVYYQSYLLGELCASQLEVAIGEATGGAIVTNRGAAQLLRTRFFGPGASLRWDALVERATGRPLSADAFVAQFVAS